MKGYSKLYPNSSSNETSREYVNGSDYNKANSPNVKKVDEVEYVSEHRMPENGTSNSVKQNYNKQGILTTERYYGEDGKPYLDIDYTDHGNSKTHPHVPHEHKISIDDDGNINREKENKING